MPTRLRKTRKKRGSKTCGYGAKKKHRGGGSRGGRGKAGIFKHKKSLALKYEPERLESKPGFKIPSAVKKTVRKINLIGLEKIIRSSEKKNEAANIIKIDLKEIGFDKLLGKGKISKPIIVKGSVSRKAKEKIEKAGGKVVGEETEEKISVNEEVEDDGDMKIRSPKKKYAQEEHVAPISKKAANINGE